MTNLRGAIFASLLLNSAVINAFQCSLLPRRIVPSCHPPLFLVNDDSAGVEEDGDGLSDDFVAHGSGRRSFLSMAGCSFLASVAVHASTPSLASAGIDVTGLTVEGGGGRAGGASTMASQLKAYDGSASTRVQEIKAAQSSGPTTLGNVPPRTDSQEDPSVAKAALRYGDGYTKLSRVGIGQKTRYEDILVGPRGSKLSVSFEYPTDWLQLDRALGGIEYVDQRNGDKLYVLRATLPEGTTLATAPRAFFGDAIFSPKGSISRGGTNIDEYKVSSSVVTEAPYSSTRRRLGLKFATVTGNGLRVERRGLVDAYEVDSDVYMLLTSSNAVKFEKKGIERETVEAIVDSFRCEKVV